MIGKEAAAVLEQQFHVRFSQSCGLMNGQANCVSTMNTHLTPGKRFVFSIIMRNERFSLSLGFTESYPFHVNRPEILTQIGYSPALKTAADGVAFARQVIQKYGPGLTQSKDSAFWCSRGRAIGHPIQYLCGGSTEVPYMNLAAGTLDLNQFDCGSRRNHALERNQEQCRPPPL
jgi:hypothetical protein